MRRSTRQLLVFWYRRIRLSVANSLHTKIEFMLVQKIIQQLLDELEIAQGALLISTIISPCRNLSKASGSVTMRI